MKFFIVYLKLLCCPKSVTDALWRNSSVFQSVTEVLTDDALLPNSDFMCVYSWNWCLFNIECVSTCIDEKKKMPWFRHSIILYFNNSRFIYLDYFMINIWILLLSKHCHLNRTTVPPVRPIVMSSLLNNQHGCQISY